MKVTFNGNPLTLEGTTLKVGDTVENFTVIANDLSPVSLKDTKGKRLFLAVPSVDTGVCDMEIRKFNEKVSELENVTAYTVSMDLPFAQGRWCGNSGVKNVVTLSDYKDKEFGKSFGVYIKELGLLSRATFVLDENNVVTYVEYLEEITNEPNYEKALDALKN